MAIDGAVVAVSIASDGAKTKSRAVAVWIAARAWYFAGYSKALEKRLPGYFIQSAACLVLLIGAAVGIVMKLGST